MRKNLPPKNAFHKATGQARVRFSGREIYLGKYGSPESFERYSQIIDEWRTAQKCFPDISIDAVCLLYFQHAKTHYVK